MGWYKFCRIIFARGPHGTLRLLAGDHFWAKLGNLSVVVVFSSVKWEYHAGLCSATKTPALYWEEEECKIFFFFTNTSIFKPC